MNKYFSYITIFFIMVFASPIIYASPLEGPVTESISTSELIEFETLPANIKLLITTALNLATMNLTYKYGSASPIEKGMDCSGTIYYLLNKIHVTAVPRQSDQIYLWVNKNGHFYPENNDSQFAKDFSHLKPGDLLFWSGTYAIQRAVPVTHVMMYLGKNRKGEPLMFGASDGRTYQGKKMWGVSVFDFNLPRHDSKSQFLGYGCIPGLTCIEVRPQSGVKEG